MRIKHSLVTCITLSLVLFFAFVPMTFAESTAWTTASITTFFQPNEILGSVSSLSQLVILSILAFVFAIAWIIKHSALFSGIQQSLRTTINNLIATVKLALAVFAPDQTAYRQPK
jgi:hypothetical protein